MKEKIFTLNAVLTALFIAAAALSFFSCTTPVDDITDIIGGGEETPVVVDPTTPGDDTDPSITPDPASEGEKAPEGEEPQGDDPIVVPPAPETPEESDPATPGEEGDEGEGEPQNPDTPDPDSPEGTEPTTPGDSGNEGENEGESGDGEQGNDPEVPPVTPEEPDTPQPEDPPAEPEKPATFDEIDSGAKVAVDDGDDSTPTEEANIALTAEEIATLLSEFTWTNKGQTYTFEAIDGKLYTHINGSDKKEVTLFQKKDSGDIQIKYQGENGMQNLKKGN